MLKNICKIVALVLLLAMMLIFVPSPISTYDAFAEVIELPIDQTGGVKFNKDNYQSETLYEDPSIRAEIFWGGRIHDTNYVYAVVKVANATQVRTAMAGDRYNIDYTIPGHKMSEAKNAVIAINGDYFRHSDHQNGYMIRMGKQYRNRPHAYWDILMIDQNGDFHTIMEPSKEKLANWLEENKDITVVNSFNFGPVIISDGKVTQEDFNVVKNHDYIGTHKDCQRMAICQLDTLTYLLVTSEGPEDKDSKGLTMDQFVDCLLEIDEKLTDYTIKVAYNLDGGSSSTLVFQNEKVNAPTNPKVRYLSDIIYFASAWQE